MHWTWEVDVTSGKCILNLLIYWFNGRLAGYSAASKYWPAKQWHYTFLQGEDVWQHLPFIGYTKALKHDVNIYDIWYTTRVATVVHFNGMITISEISQFHGITQLLYFLNLILAFFIIITITWGHRVHQGTSTETEDNTRQHFRKDKKAWEKKSKQKKAFIVVDLALLWHYWVY